MEYHLSVWIPSEYTSRDDVSYFYIGKLISFEIIRSSLEIIEHHFTKSLQDFLMLIYGPFFFRVWIHYDPGVEHISFRDLSLRIHGHGKFPILLGSSKVFPLYRFRKRSRISFAFYSLIRLDFSDLSFEDLKYLRDIHFLYGRGLENLVFFSLIELG